MTGYEKRRRVGEILPPFELETLAHGRLSVPGSKLLHLQFRRFAGCPVCNVHIRRFAAAHAELGAAGVQTVSLFYSSRETMLGYQHELPHPVVADQERHFFDAFLVERSRSFAVQPRVWATAIGGLLSGPSNPFEDAAPDGLPADFLIAPRDTRESEPCCQIMALHYGASIDDQWSVDEVLRLSKVHASPGVPTRSFSSSTIERGEIDHVPAQP